MKPAPKMRKPEPEDISGSTALSRSVPSSAQREKLAERVEKLVDEAFSMYEGSLKKLKELRPMIAQLRQQFMELKPNEKIARCRTWTEYCERVLHRTDRRIRQILEGDNPASAKHSRKSLQVKVQNAQPEPTRFVRLMVESSPPEPKTVKVPEVQNAEWTRESVVDTSFTFVYSVFQKAKLPDEDHNKAVLQLIDKLRTEVLLGNGVAEREMWGEIEAAK